MLPSSQTISLYICYRPISNPKHGQEHFKTGQPGLKLAGFKAGWLQTSHKLQVMLGYLQVGYTHF